MDLHMKSGLGFGQLLRRYRNEAGLTQEELAERAGLSVRAVSDMERGRTARPLVRSVRLLADALELPEPGRAQLIAALLPAKEGEPGSMAAADATTPLPLPRQLPAALAHFAGRAAELKLLADELERVAGEGGAVVIAAVGGTAGVGKTALAVQFAHQASEAFPDGQLYVNLRGFGPAGGPATPEEAVRGFLDALGVPAERIPAGLDAQAALYRSLLAGRRVLVVLDNARDEEQVRPLLPGSAGCLAVITSRRQLAGLAAAQEARLLNLDVLSDSEAIELLAVRLGSDRVGAEPAAAAQIAELCARLPLALAIAAARAATRPGLRLAQVAAELRQAGQRLDALDTGDPAASVRAVFSWSYQNLSEPAAAMFRQLGLHPGPDISIPAAASLAGVSRPAARLLLGQLASAHLLEEGAAGRFAFHDLLRAYARELVTMPGSETENNAVMRRLLDHYLHTAHVADRLLSPGRTPIALTRCEPGVNPEGFVSGQQALAWFEAERRVLRAATILAAAAGFDAHAWQIPWTLEQFFDWRGHPGESLAAQRTALGAARRAGDISGQAHAHRDLAHACMKLGRLGDSLAHLNQALSLYGELGDVAGQADAHLLLGHLCGRRGQLGDHLRHEQQALHLYQAHGQRYGQANALNDIAYAHVQLGNYPEALTCCRQALDLYSQLGSRFYQAAAWDTLGDVQQQLGSHAEAVACYQQALNMFQEVGSRYYQSVTFTNLGDSYLATGEAEAAARAWRQALNILTALNHPRADQVRAKLAKLPASHHELPGPDGAQGSRPRAFTGIGAT